MRSPPPRLWVFSFSFYRRGRCLFEPKMMNCVVVVEGCRRHLLPCWLCARGVVHGCNNMFPVVSSEACFVGFCGLWPSSEGRLTNSYVIPEDDFPTSTPASLSSTLARSQTTAFVRSSTYGIIVNKICRASRRLDRLRLKT